MDGIVLRTLLAATILLSGLDGIARAHPHVFIDADVGLVFQEDTTLSALRISWTYDEFTTLFLMENFDIDPDGDGVLTDADRAAIIKSETDWPDSFNGDVYLEVDGTTLPLGRPEDQSASLSKGRITVAFVLALNEPAKLVDRTSSLRLYDPYYYYSYTVTSADLIPAEGAVCGATVIPFEADAIAAQLQVKLLALSREEVPQQENVGRLFSDEVQIRCE